VALIPGASFRRKAHEISDDLKAGLERVVWIAIAEYAHLLAYRFIISAAAGREFFDSLADRKSADISY